MRNSGRFENHDTTCLNVLSNTSTFVYCIDKMTRQIEHVTCTVFVNRLSIFFRRKRMTRFFIKLWRYVVTCILTVAFGSGVKIHQFRFVIVNVLSYENYRCQFFWLMFQHVHINPQRYISLFNLS